jgi:hypothetical protein
MVLNTLLLTAVTTLSLQLGDTASRVADTLRIEPLGVRFTIPALWMGRTPDDPSASGALGCQRNVSAPIEQRIVTAPEQLAQIFDGIYAPKRTYQTALDSLVPRAAMVAHVGGHRFNGNCVTPQIHVFVASAASIDLSALAATAERIVGREYTRIARAESDSGAWHIVHLSWTDAKTDWIKPASLEIRFRRYVAQVLVLGIMDAWADPRNAGAFVSSLRLP